MKERVFLVLFVFALVSMSVLSSLLDEGVMDASLSTTHAALPVKGATASTSSESLSEAFWGVPKEAPNDVNLSCPGCNIIILNIELLRADHVGLLNPEKNLTPNIDKFFENSIIFEQATAASGETRDSFMSVIFSRETITKPDSPTQAGRTTTTTLADTSTGAGVLDRLIGSASGAVRTTTTTFAGRLNYSGQKVSPGGLTQQRNFSTSNANSGSFYGFTGGGMGGMMQVMSYNQYYYTCLVQGRKILLVLDPRSFNRNSSIPPSCIVLGDGDMGEGLLFENQSVVVAEAIASQQMQPFFIYLHSDSLHKPYHYPLDRIQAIPPGSRVDVENNTVILDYDETLNFMSRSTVVEGPFEKGERGNIMYVLTNAGRYRDYTYDDYYRLRATYERQLSYVDEGMARIFDALGEETLNNTIVVLYSNHGEGLMDNGVYGHIVDYQSCVHAPLLIHHPNVNHTIRIETPVSLVDLVPTLYEMVGVDINQPLQGYSMVPLIEGGVYGREYIYGKDPQYKFVRKGDWKLIIVGSEIKELYNLREDPHETKNLYNENKTIAYALEAALIEKTVGGA